MAAVVLATAVLGSASSAKIPKAQVLLTGYLPWANFTVNPAGLSHACTASTASTSGWWSQACTVYANISLSHCTHVGTACEYR